LRSRLAWTMYRHAKSGGFPRAALERLSRPAKRQWI
jgi:hypothetical protein